MDRQGETPEFRADLLSGFEEGQFGKVKYLSFSKEDPDFDLNDGNLIWGFTN